MTATPPSRRSSFVALVVVALTMLVLCALCAGILYAIGYQRGRAAYLKNYRGPTSAEMRISMAMEYAEKSTEDNEVLLLGDATCESISTAAVEKATGLRAWNLCVVGLVESDGMALLLRRYLEHHPAPRLVVLVRHPHSLLWLQVSRSPGLARKRYDFLHHFGLEGPETPLSFAGQFEANVQEGWWGLIGMAAGAFGRPLNALVNDCEGREEARSLFSVTVPTDAVLPDTTKRCPGVPLQQVREQYARNRGAEGGALQAADPTAPGQHNDAHLRGQKFVPLPHETVGMDDIVGQAMQRHIPTVVRFAPVLDRTEEQVDMVDRWLKALAVRNPGIAIAQPHLLQYDPGLFADMLHLNAAGAEQLTGQVIEDVRAMLGRPQQAGPAVAPAGP